MKNPNNLPSVLQPCPSISGVPRPEIDLKTGQLVGVISEKDQPPKEKFLGVFFDEYHCTGYFHEGSGKIFRWNYDEKTEAYINITRIELCDDLLTVKGDGEAIVFSKKKLDEFFDGAWDCDVRYDYANVSGLVWFLILPRFESEIEYCLDHGCVIRNLRPALSDPRLPKMDPRGPKLRKAIVPADILTVRSRLNQQNADNPSEIECEIKLF